MKIAGLCLLLLVAGCGQQPASLVSTPAKSPSPHENYESLRELSDLNTTPGRFQFHQAGMAVLDTITGDVYLWHHESHTWEHIPSPIDGPEKP